jgi:taurine dioxygenase
MQSLELRNDPFRRITVTPFTGTFGAEIADIDLNTIDDETVDEIRTAMLKYSVLFFHGQDFTPETQAAFGRRFGVLNRHPYVKPIDGHPDVFLIVKKASDKHHFGNGWHTDLAYAEAPASATILYGIDVPVAGGDTMFASHFAAYDALSDGLKNLLADMNAVYTNAHTYGKDANRFKDGVSKEMSVELAAVNEVSHPVIRTHPESGRKGLYLSPLHFSRFEGMTPEESKPLFDTLVAHATQPEFTCRFRWSNGSVAMWDNRSTMHYAINDFSGLDRTMQRVTLEGDIPV